MRLICPNCDAQYEVDAAAIPLAGRDVQCSSCGHAWFQAHPDVEREHEAEAALHDAPHGAPRETAAEVADPVIAAPAADQPGIEAPAVAASAADTPMAEDTAALAAAATDTPPANSPVPELARETATETGAETETESESESESAIETGTPEPTETADPQHRQIDEAVMAVLREEAQREMIARRLEAEAAIEVQPELGIEAAAAPQSAAARHIAKLKGDDPDAAPAPEPEPKRELSRREMLPDIEEINSSLRPGDVAVDDDGETFEIVQRPQRRSGFRSGFVMMLLVAIGIVALYVMAPRISEQFPAAKPGLDAYVAGVDSARGWLDATTRAVVTSLQGLAGKDDTP
jgi:predicted Zn finger-like uncharacterized protein